MSEKQKLIREMLTMQKQFMEREKRGGIEPEEYYSPEEGDDLEGYQSRYDKLANRVVDLAHEEKGSGR